MFEDGFVGCALWQILLSCSSGFKYLKPPTFHTEANGTCFLQSYIFGFDAARIVSDSAVPLSRVMGIAIF